MKTTAKEVGGARARKTPVRRTVKTATPLRWPTEHEIRARAYSIYQGRGCSHGRALDDWLQAERELLTEYGH